MLKKTADRILKLNSHLVLFEKGLLCLLLFTMLFLSMWQIALRNFFSGGIFWIDHILRLCVLWIAFIGASLAFEYKKHIKIDILINVIHSSKTKAAVSVIAELATMIICLLLFIASANYIDMVSSSSRATIIKSIPDWYFRLVIPYTFLVMTIRGPLNIYRLLYPFPHDKKENE